MRRSLWLSFVLAVGLAGCGNDGNGTPGEDGGTTDTGVTDPCEDLREVAPDPEGLMGPCCYRKSNADDLANPEFRIAGVDLQTPPSIGNPVVAVALAEPIDEEIFNWLLRIEGAGADGDVMITTGYGLRNPDATFRFADGDAPTADGGDPARWDPVNEPGTLEGETVTSQPASETIVLPVFDEAGETVQIELPLKSLELEMANMSEQRSCIGERARTSFDTSQGFVRTFITVEDAKAGRIEIPGFMNTLCNLIAGRGASAEGDCDSVDRSEWMYTPDSLCEGITCTEDPGDGSVCDPMTDCNAWLVTGGFAAQGVEIE